MNKIFTLAANTFIEILRQPVYTVIIIAALFLTILAPSLAMYTLSDDSKFLREILLSTLFLAGLFIAIFSACGVVGEEIDNKTILTVLTKPVKRPVFIISKFLGVSCAVGLSHYICTLGMLISIRYGIIMSENLSDWTVIAITTGIIVSTLALTAFFNYVYEWRATSSAMILLAVFLTLGIIFLSFIDQTWQFNPRDNNINILDIYSSILLFFAAIIIVAIAVALSSRFNIVVTLSICIAIFLLGLISDWAFGRLAESHLWAKFLYYIVPNLQVFWISDAIYEESVVPVKYLFIGGVYAVCYTAGIISLAIGLFQPRQVG